MRQLSRRNFIGSSAAAAALFVAGQGFTSRKSTLKLSFSSLGCPDWSWDEIVNFASTHDYTGIELRGIKRELDLTKCKEFSSTDNINATLRQLQDKGLHLVDLGSSSNLHIADATDRKNNLDEAKKFIDLAQQTKCPYIRVFPNNLPKESKEAALDLITKGLIELGEYAKNTNVTVLMETHGDLVHVADIEKVITQASGPHTGLVWDISNMWTITQEPPATVYNTLKKYIKHTHIKDAKLLPGGKLDYALLGKGEVPIFEAIDLLAKDGYKGYYSFEWEKLWHPEIAAPEIALADYPVAMQQHFAAKS